MSAALDVVGHQRATSLKSEETTHLAAACSVVIAIVTLSLIAEAKSRWLECYMYMLYLHIVGSWRGLNLVHVYHVHLGAMFA